jgi:uncharacterized protein YndB with AHSA1/START domain
MSSTSTYGNGRSDRDRAIPRRGADRADVRRVGRGRLRRLHQPEVMRRWFHCARDWGTPRAEFDLGVGGKVRVVMRRPDDTEAGARGEYTLIDRPHTLVMTWTFDDDPSNGQLIKLSPAESEGLTTVPMLNSGISSDQRRAAQTADGNGASSSLPLSMEDQY